MFRIGIEVHFRFGDYLHVFALHFLELCRPERVSVVGFVCRYFDKRFEYGKLPKCRVKLHALGVRCAFGVPFRVFYADIAGDVVSQKYVLVFDVVCGGLSSVHGDVQYVVSGNPVPDSVILQFAYVVLTVEMKSVFKFCISDIFACGKTEHSVFRCSFGKSVSLFSREFHDIVHSALVVCAGRIRATAPPLVVRHLGHRLIATGVLQIYAVELAFLLAETELFVVITIYLRSVEIVDVVDKLFLYETLGKLAVLLSSELVVHLLHHFRHRYDVRFVCMMVGKVGDEHVDFIWNVRTVENHLSSVPLHHSKLHRGSSFIRIYGENPLDVARGEEDVGFSCSADEFFGIDYVHFLLVMRLAAARLDIALSFERSPCRIQTGK